MNTSANRFARRLLELAKEYDTQPALKFLLVRPSSARLNKLENLFYDKLFKDKTRLLPIEYNDPQSSTPSFSPISMRNTIKEMFVPPASKSYSEETEKAFWNILKSLLSVLTRYENEPTKGFLYDKEFFEYSSEPIKNFITKARERLENSEESNLVSLDTVQSGTTLISHPLRTSEYWRNSLIHLYTCNDERASGVILNSYRRFDGGLVRNGGSSSAGISIYAYDPSEVPNDVSLPEMLSKEGSSKEIAFTFQEKPLLVNFETFNGITIFGTTLRDEIRRGEWIPVRMKKEMIIGPFRFPQLSSYECDILRRLYWEESVRHLGPNFEGLAHLSSNYKKATFIAPEETPVQSE